MPTIHKINSNLDTFCMLGDSHERDYIDSSDNWHEVTCKKCLRQKPFDDFLNSKELKQKAIEMKARGKTILYISKDLNTSYAKLSSFFDSCIGKLDRWEDKFYNTPLTRMSKYTHDIFIDEMSLGSYQQISSSDLSYMEQDLIKHENHKELKRIN